MSVRSRVALLCCLFAVAGGLARAQDVGENKLLTLMPELRNMAAPDWLKEGVRVTYVSATATVAADRFYWWKDHTGEWRKEDSPRSSSLSYVQYRCVYRSDKGAVGTLESFLQDLNTGNLAPSSHGGAVDPAGAGACWASPAALARADRFQARDFHVIKMPQPIGDKVYNGIRFHYVGDTAVDDYVYDLASGLMLFYQHIALTADRRGTLMVQMTFAARRQVQLPVADPTAPAWLGENDPMTYRGAMTAHLQGSPPLPVPMLIQLRKSGGGARWAKYQADVQAQGQMPSTKTIFCGAAGLGVEPWMSPSLLAGLQQGQILDQDPQLGVTTGVEAVMRGPGGGDVVIISEEGRGFKRSHGYDRATGRMLLINSLQQVGVAVQQTQLELVR